MSFAGSIRSFLPLLLGVVVGVIGAIMFYESMPGAEGSLRARADQLEIELKQAKNRIAALEASESVDRHGRRSGSGSRGITNQPGLDPRKLAADRARDIAQDLREGRPVNPEEIFHASKPILRDLAPLFDRIRVKQQQEMVDSLAGKLSRKYELTPQNEEMLQQWLAEKTKEEARRWTDVVTSDQTRLEDMVRASRDIRLEDGLDTFMAGILPPDKLVAFKADRLTERAQRVQQEADMKVQRLDSVVTLDERQRDQLFGIIARSSRDYDPAMRLEGASGEIPSGAVAPRRDAMLAILRPDQRAAYDAEQQRRREEAAKHLESLGLALPPNWDMLDESDFR